MGKCSTLAFKTVYTGIDSCLLCLFCRLLLSGLSSNTQLGQPSIHILSKLSGIDSVSGYQVIDLRRVVLCTTNNFVFVIQ